MILVHLKQHRAQMVQLRLQSVKPPRDYRCQFVLDGKPCGKSFHMMYQLQKHKEIQGHHQPQGRPKKN